MGKNDNQWERHNAPNGEHIWEGNKHICDITGKSEEKLAEVTKFLVEAHNACIKINPENPLAVAKSIEDMYEIVRVTAMSLVNTVLYQHPDDKLASLQKQQIESTLAKINDDGLFNPDVPNPSEDV